MKRHIPEINVTPLIDVMLVLLVIFMVTTPMMGTQVDVTVPKVVSVHKKNKNVIKYDEIINISIDEFGNVLLNNKKISLKNLAIFLNKNGKNKPINVEVDHNLKFQKAFEVFHFLSELGFENILLSGCLV